MPPTLARVIKHDQVRMAPRRLDAEPPACEGHPLPASPVAVCPPGPGRAGARIVEMGPTSALIEVTCPCGQKSYVRCDYQN